MVTASNIPEAERLLDTVTPKTLIVDVRHLDGALELLEGLRAGGDGDRVPVVAVHGRLSKKARLRVDAVADTRLTFSELNQRSLRAALRELHDGERRTGLWAG